MQTLSQDDKVCGIIKHLYSCRLLLIFGNVDSVSEWVMLVCTFWSDLNVSFSILGGEPYKLFGSGFFLFHLFHDFSVVVVVERPLLSLANESMWNLCEFSFMDCNGPSFNCWSRRKWRGGGSAQTLQNWRGLQFYSWGFTPDTWKCEMLN